MAGWHNAEFHIRDMEHRQTRTEKHIRSALAHFMLDERRAACGYVPSERTRMLPEDAGARGAFRCERCVEAKKR